MRKRRLLIWICLAILVIYTINEIASYLGNKQQYAETTATLRGSRNNGEPKKHPEQASMDVTKPLDSVIPDMFYEKVANITPHDFRYSLNPTQYCEESQDGFKQNINVIVLVASAIREFERRVIIRRTWGSESIIDGKRIGVLFFVGNDGKISTYAKLKEEFRKYGDIVQENYVDSYRNLSLKTQGQLKWVTLYCTKAEFALHVDDDVMPDTAGILRDQYNSKSPTKEIGCAKVFKPTVRREGKWKTSIEEYPEAQYPLSCVGWCFIMPVDIVHQLYYMSLNTRILHLEDVWVTGILREKIGRTKMRMMEGGESLCHHLGWPKDRPTNEKILKAWQELKSNRDKGHYEIH